MITQTEQKIFKKIESSKKYAIKLQENLINLPAISPNDGGKGEYDKALYLEGELKKLKFDKILRLDAPDKRAKKGLRPNIAAIYKGKSSKQKLWIMSHMDIVPAGDKSMWKYPPYKLTRKGDKLFGRGVQDNNQAIASSVLAVKTLMDLKIRPQIDTVLLFVSDEEYDSNFGIKYLLKKHSKLFSKKDMFIAPDAGNEKGTQIEVAEKSLLWVKFTVTGKQTHAAEPQLGINSLTGAANLIVNLQQLKKTFGHTDKIFVPPKSTFETTKIEPNVPSVNAIPGKTMFYMDCRILPNYKIPTVLKEVKKIVRKTEKQTKAKIGIEIASEKQSPPPTPADSQIVKLIANAVRKAYKVNPRPQGIGGNTIAAHLRTAGFHTVVYQRNDMMDHMVDEYCRMSSILGDAKVIAHTAVNAAP
jgi:succinyl-diaminopimelate desuccinylase